MNRLLKKYEEQFYALAHGLKLMKIGLAVTLMGHWIGCVWYYFGTEEWHDDIALYPDGTEIQPWVTELFSREANSTGHATRCEPDQQHMHTRARMHVLVLLRIHHT